MKSVSVYFDIDTHLPIKKTYSWRDPVDKERNLEEETYDGYRTGRRCDDALWIYPLLQRRYANRTLRHFCQLQSGLDPAMFDWNSGYNPNKVSGKH